MTLLAKPSTYLLGIIAFTLIIVGGTSLMAELRKSDPTYAADEQFTQFDTTFNVYNQTSTQIGALSGGLAGNDQDWGVLGVLNGLILSAWQSLRLMVTNWAFMNGVFLGLNTMFGIPSWVGGMIILAVTVMFVFSIWAAFFRSDL
jgi:hypothetical protein